MTVVPKKSKDDKMHFISFSPRRFLTPLLTLGVCLALVVGTAHAQSSNISDSFARPDSPSIGTATSGQPWTVHAGSAAVENGRAALGSGFVLASINAGGPILNAEVTVVQPASEFWLVLRFVNDQNYWRFGRWNGQAYTLQQINANNLGTPSLEAGASLMPQAGDRVSCKVRAGLIECRINGILVVRTTDTFASAATRVGVSGYQASAARFDDFTAGAPNLPDLSVSVTGPSTIYAGSQGSWQTRVANVGTQSLLAANVTVTPPSSVSNVGITGGSCTVQGSNWYCSVGPIAAGQTTTLNIVATAPQTIGQLLFASTASTLYPEEDGANNSGSIATITRVPPPPGAVVFDDFNRTDGPAGQTYTGNPWNNYSGSLNVAGGNAAPGDSFVLASVDTGQAGGELTTTVVTPSQEFWTILRLSDGANYWRFGRWNGQSYHLQRIQANGATIYPPLVNISPAAGDALRCVYWLDQIECSVNGVPAARVADSFNGSATGVGFSSYQAPSTRFDQLLVTPPPPRIDVSVSVTGPAMIRSGQTGTWTTTFLNRSTNTVTGAEVVVTPSAQLAGVSVAGASCVIQGGQYRCSIGSLAPGGNATMVLTGIAPSAPAVVNISATTSAQPGEIQTSDNSAVYSTPVRRAIPANALVVDLFDRPNSSVLGAADTGQLWTIHSGYSGIQSNEIAVTSALVSLNVGTTGGDVSATVGAISNEFWMVLRLSDTQNYWRFGRWHDGPYILQQIRANQLGVPALQLLGTVQPAVGDQIACRVNSLGIDCAVNDVSVVRTSDTFNRTATRVGFSSYAYATVRFDDLVVVHMPSGPDLGVSVQVPSVVLQDLPQTVNVDVRNNGDSPAFNGMLTLSLPSSVAVLTAPAGCVLAPQVQCYLAASQSAGGFERFAFSFSAAATGTFAASADALVAGDAFAADNHASWNISVETSTSGIFDGFARPDTSAGLGYSLTGQPWQPLRGGFGIAASEARAAGAGALSVIDAGFAFGTVEVVLGSLPTAAGIVFRVVDANNYYRLTADQGLYRITKVVNGVVQDLQFYILRHVTTAQPGDLVRVVSRPDDGVFVAVNGRHIIDAGDQQFMYATGWGLTSVSGNPTFKSFALRPVAEGFATVDNFNGTQDSWIGTPTSGVNYHWLRWMGPHWINSGGAARPEWDAYTVTTMDTSSERASVKAKLIQPGNGGWLVFRYVEAGTYFRFGHTAGAAYDVDYALGDSVLAMPVAVQKFATIYPAPGDVLDVKQAADGTVECRVNGILTHRFVEPIGPGFRSTLTGMAGTDSTVAFDNFEVTPLPR